MPEGGASKQRNGHIRRGATHGGTRSGTGMIRRLTKEQAQDQLVRFIETGQSIAAALEKVGRSRKTYEMWRHDDEAFRRRVDTARQLRQRDPDQPRNERLPFAEWRKKYLGVDTYWHQLQWVDVLEGREPRDLHPAQTYSPAKRNRVLVNCPPFHAKTATITIDYSVYRLCMDPSFRILLISAGQELAKDFLFGIKQRLTDPDYIELQKAYAPEGGWESTAEAWSDSKIVFSQEHRASSGRGFHEKDANVLALGMRSKVYGRRADLAIVDDGVDTTNVAEYTKQMKWLRSMVESRLEAGGRLLVVGTRVSPIDLYSELMKPENYANGVPVWTYLASPAVLEESEDPAQMKTLWPYASVPWVRPEEVDVDECLCEETHSCTAGYELDGVRVFPRWDGVHLTKGPMSSNSATDWALIYQQTSVPDDATFPEFKVTRATNSIRLAGRLEQDKHGHPMTGMHGKYVIAGLDPSIKGFAGMVVAAVDRETQKRYILNAWNIKAPTKDQLVEKMKQVTELYGVNEWRVEKTGLLQFFTQDSVMRQWFSTRGIRFTEHYTHGGNKWDAAFGVSSLGALFGEYARIDIRTNMGGDANWKTITDPLIELPRPNTDGIKALIHQLVTWTPDLDPKRVPCDMVMALWFLEIGAREHLGYGKSSGSNVQIFARSNRFISPSRRQTSTVRLSDFRR